ncbi:MAG TPA: hypothetical protein H9722_07225 [Candidatus Mediterraneibacter pullistercoris]|nr:hypothetical protein [Candidatus Mediterraneibacter pullistercoris]
MILKNNEEKRSTLWRTVLTVSSVLIVIIAVFFIVKLFTDNPLEGTWISEDTGQTLVIRDKGELTVSPSDGSGDEEFTAHFSVDTRTKVLTVQTESSGGILSGTYNYNVEQDTLTLTEREYGNQMVFVRK